MSVNSQDFIKKYKLEDFLDKTYKIIKDIWKDSLIMSSSLMVPASIFYSISLINLSNNILEQVHFIGKLPEKIISSYISSYFIFFVSSIIFSIFYLFVFTAITKKTYYKIDNKNLLLKEICLEILKKDFLNILKQFVVLLFIFSGIIFVFILSGSIFAGGFLLPYFQDKKNSYLIAFVIFFVVILIVFLCIYTWMNNSLSFAIQCLIYDKKRPIKSILRSFYLVNKKWWRIFGINFIFNSILSFIMSLVTGPLMLIPFTIVFFQLAEGLKTNIYYSLLDVFTKNYILILIVLSILILIQAVFYSIVLPVFKSLFYIDIKIRNKELQG